MVPDPGKGGQVRLRAAHVDLVALDLHAGQGGQDSGQVPDCPVHPGPPLFFFKEGVRVQKSQSPGGAALLGAVGVADGAPQHLEASADAEDHASPLPAAVDGGGHAGLPEPAQVAQGVLGPGQDDHVGNTVPRRQGLRPRHIAQVQLRDPGKNIEVRKIGQVGEADHRDLHRLSRGRPVGPGQLGGQGVLVVDIQLHIGHDAHDRDAAPLLQHLHAGVQDGLVAAEFIDDHALEQGLLVRLQQHLGAQELGEDSAPVDVAGQQDRGPDRLCQAHVDDVVRLEVDLRGTPRALDHYDIIFLRQRLIGLQDHGHEALFVGKIFAGIHIAQDLSLHDDLGARVGGRLEQDGVHAHVRQDPGRLGLHDLGPAHLQALLRDIGIEGHILGLEGGHPEAVLAEDPAQARGQKALARIGHGSLDHDRFCHYFLHSLSCRPGISGNSGGGVRLSLIAGSVRGRCPPPGSSTGTYYLPPPLPYCRLCPAASSGSCRQSPLPRSWSR